MRKKSRGVKGREAGIQRKEGKEEIVRDRTGKRIGGCRAGGGLGPVCGLLEGEKLGREMGGGTATGGGKGRLVMDRRRLRSRERPAQTHVRGGGGVHGWGERKGGWVEGG